MLPVRGLHSQTNPSCALGSRRMSQTFVFEELDEATRDYLIAVRDARGCRRAGCVRSHQIVHGRVRVHRRADSSSRSRWLSRSRTGSTSSTTTRSASPSFRLPAFSSVGGCSSPVSGRPRMKGSSKIAGNWVYVDSLHLYEAISRAGEGHADRRRSRGELHAQLQQRRLPEQRRQHSARAATHPQRSR